jgi:hypothetical protein
VALKGENMDTDLRLVAKIARAIADFSDAYSIDEQKCERIARLIDGSEARDRIEAMVEQYADRIDAMKPEDFVGFLADAAASVDDTQENIGEPSSRLDHTRHPLVS